MSTNKTSEAVDRIESDVNLIERKAIAEKYKRMEEALRSMQSLVSKMTLDAPEREIPAVLGIELLRQKEALAFDPLSLNAK